MMPRRFVLCALSLAMLCSCSERKIRKVLIQSNPGLRSDHKRLVRWPLPVQVNTAGIERADEAVANIERLTGGVVRFQKVSRIPENGIVFVDGGAMNGDGSPGCGHVSGGAPGQVQANFHYDGQSRLIGVYYVHLGSTRCLDASRGKRRSAVAEHELAHALGLASHFEDFTGNEGVSAERVRAVIYSLYRNPIGTTLGDLKVFQAPDQTNPH
jgi:hypothetical protein